MPAPENCHSMTELRAEIDRLDRQLIALLSLRAGCIDRAIEIKARDGLPARISARVDEVIDNARAEAARTGLDPALAGALWSQIVEWSIAREERALGPSKEG